MSFDSNLGPSDAIYPPDQRFLDQLEFQFVRIGGLLLAKCQQSVPVPPQFKRDYPEGVFETNVGVLKDELDKGLGGIVRLRMQGPYHNFGQSIAGASSGRAFSFEHSGRIVKLGLYTNIPLDPILYGHVPRGLLLGGDNGEPIAMVFASAEMPPVIADIHELVEANQERIRDGELRDLGDRSNTVAHELIDYNKKLDDAGEKPHYLDEAGQLAIIKVLVGAEPNAGWSLDMNEWALK